MARYFVTNTTGASLQVVDSAGVSIAVRPLATVAADLTDAGAASARAAVGAAAVVAAPVTQLGSGLPGVSGGVIASPGTSKLCVASAHGVTIASFTSLV